jgi:dihydroorotate dehydrogenase electron transfer subunit
MAPVISNSPLTGDYWLLELEAPAVATGFAPGQFVNIRIDDRVMPFTRRPFSIYRASKDRQRIQVAYKIVGEGTRLMSQTLRPGGRCDVIGPLGKGFALPPQARRIAVVGRGIGIAALPTLVEEAVRRGIEVVGFVSARTTPNLVALDIFAELGCTVVTHTDDDRSVRAVTDHLARLDRPVDAAYVCGSKRLARAVHDYAQRCGIPAEVAMEQLMACGFGDCHGCVIRVNLDPQGREQAWREVCHFGPVFQTWEIVNACA